ncbi:MAG: hypothetical protein VX638_08815 [Chloroflexota bacterium]|nr:hypothetical protein [Chloroflexota bacterium]
MAVIIGVSVGSSGGDDAPVDTVLDPDPTVTVPAIVVRPTDTQSPPTPKYPTPKPTAKTLQIPTIQHSPTTLELGYTVTPPPLPSVHVATIEIV